MNLVAVLRTMRPTRPGRCTLQVCHNTPCQAPPYTMIEFLQHPTGVLTQLNLMYTQTLKGFKFKTKKIFNSDCGVA